MGEPKPHFWRTVLLAQPEFWEAVEAEEDPANAASAALRIYAAGGIISGTSAAARRRALMVAPITSWRHLCNFATAHRVMSLAREEVWRNMPDVMQGGFSRYGRGVTLKSGT